MAAARPRSEFRSSWRPLLGSTLGLSFSVATVLLYTFGVFVIPLEAAYGWTRGELFGVIMALQLGTAVSGPLCGWLIDKLNARAVILASQAALGTMVIALSWIADELWHFYLAFALIPVLAAGAIPVSYSRLLVDTFDRARGLAIGIALAGVGIGGALLPLLAEWLIRVSNWRIAYLALGVAALAAILPLAFFLPQARTSMREAPAGAVPPRPIPRLEHFVPIAIVFSSLGLITVAALAHLVPILRARGFAAADAALGVSVASLAVIAGRLLIGYMLDRVGPVPVALAVIANIVTALVLLAMCEGDFVAFAAAAMIGLSIGAEMDVLAFLVSRNFPLEQFGRLYGWLFSLFVAASGMGPLLLGWLHDRSGSYFGPLLLLALAGLVAGALCPLMSIPAARGVTFLPNKQRPVR